MKVPEIFSQFQLTDITYKWLDKNSVEFESNNNKTIKMVYYQNFHKNGFSTDICLSTIMFQK